MLELFKPSRLVFQNAIPESGVKVENKETGSLDSAETDNDRKAIEIANSLITEGMKGKTVVIGGVEYNSNSTDAAYKKYIEFLKDGISEALVIALKEAKEKGSEISDAELKEQGGIAMNYLVEDYANKEKEKKETEATKKLITSADSTDDTRFTTIRIGDQKFEVADDVAEKVMGEFVKTLRSLIYTPNMPADLYAEGNLKGQSISMFKKIVDDNHVESKIFATKKQEKETVRVAEEQKKVTDSKARIERANTDSAIKEVISRLPSQITVGPIRPSKMSMLEQDNIRKAKEKAVNTILSAFKKELGVEVDESTALAVKAWVTEAVSKQTDKLKALKNGEQITITLDFSEGRKDLYVLALDNKGKAPAVIAEGTPAVATEGAPVIAPAADKSKIATTVEGALASDQAKPGSVVETFTAKVTAKVEAGAVKGAPEATEVSFNEDQLLDEITVCLSNEDTNLGFDLTRYEAKGSKSLNAAQRKMTREEVKAYFESKGGATVLKQIFDKGIEKVTLKKKPINLTEIVREGLTWWEELDHETRKAAVPEKAPDAEVSAEFTLESLKDPKKIEEVKALLEAHKKYRLGDWNTINPKLIAIITGKEATADTEAGKAIITDLQKKLVEAGQDVGRDGTDGLAGKNTLNALAKYIGVEDTVRRGGSGSGSGSTKGGEAKGDAQTDGAKGGEVQGDTQTDVGSVGEVQGDTQTDGGQGGEVQTDAPADVAPEEVMEEVSGVNMDEFLELYNSIAVSDSYKIEETDGVLKIFKTATGVSYVATEVKIKDTDYTFQIRVNVANNDDILAYEPVEPEGQQSVKHLKGKNELFKYVKEVKDSITEYDDSEKTKTDLFEAITSIAATEGLSIDIPVYSKSTSKDFGINIKADLLKEGMKVGEISMYSNISGEDNLFTKNRVALVKNLDGKTVKIEELTLEPEVEVENTSPQPEVVPQDNGTSEPGDISEGKVVPLSEDPTTQSATPTTDLSPKADEPQPSGQIASAGGDEDKPDVTYPEV